MKLLETFFSSEAKIKILRRVAKAPDWAFTASEIASDTGMNKVTVGRVMRDLEGSGIVACVSKGRVRLFTLNKHSIFIKSVLLPIFDIESAVQDVIISELRGLFEKMAGRPVSVILYGSYVKGTATPKSDVDIMLVADGKDMEEAEKLLGQFSSRAMEEHDLLVMIMPMTTAEFRKNHKLGEPFIIDVAKTGKAIIGKEPGEILHED